LTLTLTPRATVHPWGHGTSESPIPGTPSQQILSQAMSRSTHDLHLYLHYDLGPRYTSLVHLTQQTLDPFRSTGTLRPWFTLLSRLSTHCSPLTRKYTDHGTATMSQYTSIHLDSARSQVPAKIEFYLPKQCRNTHPITDSNNQLALCNSSEQ